MKVPPRPPLLDVALAAGLTLLGIAQVMTEGGSTRVAVLVATITVPVALRRAVPLAAVALPWFVLFLEGGLKEDVTSQGYAAILALWITIYSVARHGSGRQPIAGLMWALACVWSSVLLSTGIDAASLFLATIITVAPWAAGYLIRRERGLRSDAEERSRQLAMERARHAGEAVAAERTRIAREVHDVLGHTLGLIVLQLGAAEQALANSPGTARESVRTARSAGKAALAEVRYLIGLHGTVQGDGQPMPGMDDVPALIDRTRDAGLDIVARIEPIGPLPAAADLAAYRIVQESLTNAMKHGTDSDSVELVIESHPTEVHITVENAAPVAVDDTGVAPPATRRTSRSLSLSSLTSSAVPSGSW
jgi:signal transduction histidine kinase